MVSTVVQPSPRRATHGGRLQFRPRLVILSCLLSFCLGFLLSSLASPQQISVVTCDAKAENDYRQKIEILNDLLSKCRRREQQSQKQQEGARERSMFRRTTSGIAVSAARVSKDELLAKFDPGVPLWPHDSNVTHRSEMDALLFYSHEIAEPKSLVHNFDRLPVPEAIANCKSVELVLGPNPSEHSCLALVANGESQGSSTVFRWLKSNENEDAFERASLGRGAHDPDQDELPLPQTPWLQKYRKQLSSYLSIVDDILIPFVRPILDAVVQTSANDRLVVTAVNTGHFDLLQNFVCSCQANKLDLSMLVVFCMDSESEQMAEAFGLTTVYHADLFGAVPHQDADFGSDTFQAIVYSKLVVPHLLTIMGFSFLYQDVDIVWYQHPLVYLKEHGYIDQFDLLFQDDGDHQTHLYAPFFANSGFYYVKNNARTQFFFRQLLYNADTIPGWYSDQTVFEAFLPEAVRLLGLAVKILPQRQFPGGHFYELSLPSMKEIVTKAYEPVMFHMHFTRNKAQKILQMKQAGMWYLMQSNDDIAATEYVCSPKPVVECFHWDRPSAPACRNDQSMTNIEEDGDGTRFWSADGDE